MVTGMHRVRFGLAAAGLLALLASCNQPAVTPTQTGTSGVANTAATATPVPLKPLRTNPEVDTVGKPFTITVEGLAPQKEVEFLWETKEGGYETKVDQGSIEFLSPIYTVKKLSLGRATTDAQGNVTTTFTTPRDYGETHNIVAVMDGQDVAKGGFYLQRSVTVSPLEGPIGTPITVEVTGLGYSPFQSTAGLRWDNQYMGFLSSTTTAGSATAVIRAAGPVGEHFIDFGPASAAVPYLNPHQTPRKIKIPTFRFAFKVTADQGAPAPTLEWPVKERVSKTPTIPLIANPTGTTLTATAELTPNSGPILSKPALKATGLTPNGPVDLIWMTVTGSDVTGWSGADHSLGEKPADDKGGLATTLEIPDGLGGWHVLTLVQEGKIKAQVPYYVERSLITAPAQVKAGQPFKVEIKGVGWTELDNGVAVLYDNTYVGYACGFGSGGSVEVELMAMGGPGTHIIDLYPMIYNRGFSKKHLWNYQVPMLSFAQDHPGLSMGYNLPVFRLAVQVVP